jgi:hydroxymethylpyrimidine/phosphomethylpyrimidine kinase
LLDRLDRPARPARPRKQRTCVLAVGGLDPGGGAGLLADARAIAHAGAFACCAAALLTVQSTSGLRSATPVPARQLTAQCAEVLKVQRVGALKVGALGSVENVRAVGALLAIHRAIPAVVDTVMLPTRGRSRLLDERAVASLVRSVLPRAALVTANAPEAEVLARARVSNLAEARAAARAILALGALAVLVKGGHVGTTDDAVDILALRSAGGRVRLVELRSRRLALPPTHGGGCTLASLIAGRLATHGPDIAAAVRWAKKVHHEALRKVGDVGGDMRVLFA